MQKWTKERCLIEGKQYKTRDHFRRGSQSAYMAARREGWLDEVCLHMTGRDIMWTKERCHEEALKYDTRRKFQDVNKSAYAMSIRNGWLDEVCSHMKYVQNGMFVRSTEYWTKEHCHEASLRYEIRNDFRKGNHIAYSIARKNEWLNEICTHMRVVGNLYKRCIYVYEFPDNHAYVGLTCNMKTRNISHKEQGTVFKYSKITGLQPIYRQLTDYVSTEEAKKLEEEFLKKYTNDKWSILNKNKTGGVGGGYVKWTKEKCKAEALKYKSRSEFADKSSGAYGSSLRNKWLDELCEHMEQKISPPGFWTKDRCQIEALKYKTRVHFYKNDMKTYNQCQKHKWLDELCKHMTNKWSRV